MQRGRILIVAGALIAAAALLFPFFTASTLGDISGRSGPSLLPLAALAACGLVAVAGDRGERLNGLSAVAAAAAATLAAVLTGALLIDALLAARDATALGYEGAAGAGLWLTAIAAGVAVVGVLVGMSRRLN